MVCVSVLYYMIVHVHVVDVAQWVAVEQTVVHIENVSHHSQSSNLKTVPCSAIADVHTIFSYQLIAQGFIERGVRPAPPPATVSSPSQNFENKTVFYGSVPSKRLEFH